MLVQKWFRFQSSFRTVYFRKRNKGFGVNVFKNLTPIRNVRQERYRWLLKTV